jgi:predicted DNA-binding transcriptional regulator AlpA
MLEDTMASPLQSNSIYTVTEFCSLHRISRSLFYKLLRHGQGPRVMKVGARSLITSEAAQAWRRNNETTLTRNG